MKSTTALIIKYTAASQVILVKEVKPSISEAEVLEIATKLFGKSKTTEAIEAHTFCVVDLSSGNIINTFLGTADNDESILLNGFTDFSFLAVDDGALYDNCDKSAIKLLIKTILSKKAYKQAKSFAKDRTGKKPTIQELLQVLIGVEIEYNNHKNKNNTTDSTDAGDGVAGTNTVEDVTNGDVLIEMLKVTDLTKEEVELLESGQIPESIKARLPKEVQETLKTSSVKVTSLDLNQLPFNVKLQVQQLLNGRDVGELSSSERAKLLALAKTV